MKRVLIFALTYFPYTGGTAVAIKEITDRLPDIEFDMVTLRFDARLPRVERIGNVLVHRIGFVKKDVSTDDLYALPLHANKHWYQLWATFSAMRLHRHHPYHAIWAVMAHAAGIPAGLFRSFHDVPYLLTLQEGDPTDYVERLMRPVWPLFRRAFTTADALQAISGFLLAWGRRMGFRGEGEVVPNGVDFARFSRRFSPEEMGLLRAKLGCGSQDTILVTTSRLAQKNGVDTIIEALGMLPERVKLVVCGVGPLEQALAARVEALRLGSRVTFLGEVPHADLPLILAACDIFVRPSRSEGMGNSFIEAMAAGLPVIATQQGGLADFLFDRRRNPEKAPTGYAVDADAPGQIVGAVKQILDHPEERDEIRANARRLARSYDWAGIAGRMEQILVRLMDKNSQPSSRLAPTLPPR
ncbi:MAG: glycosyltransferase [Pseudomonadota bacterium]|nr:glycosyltransferase [Pseudomonadota bacterium]